ncbi:hypothetical protein [Pedobacter soli]|uniref:Uncharacterized protein n=1 Tax=Pedobacter soli TaxID=390242 RepID=A0A1G6NG21_9SPHI|nr:hypothetical protein [Pedobacter soli]SDC66384.1 hypothetical protein SAMN04488024_102656 [Pedobacter soli]
MLKNELKDIEEILFEQKYSDSNRIVQIDIEKCFSQIHRAWEKVIFSDIPENSLVRYFHYHLEVITNISDNLYRLEIDEKLIVPQSKLLELIDHLRKYYSNYFNENVLAPLMYHQRLMCQLSNSISYIRQRLQASNLNASLITCLVKWFDLMSEDTDIIKFNFCSLHYFEYVVKRLSSIDYDSEDAETSLVSLLVRSNFNNLTFLVYYQDYVGIAIGDLKDSHEKLRYLVEQKAEVFLSPEVKKLAYDHTWPPLKTMITDWLQEEILLTKKSACNKNAVAVPKIPLAMSVAHLSCLIRLLYEESVFATQNLQSIFKGFAGYFQSKRQVIISPGSLSKEFYSIDQHTAARVRDLLQRMIQRINRNFFPMVFAINATVLSYLSMR